MKAPIQSGQTSKSVFKKVFTAVLLLQAFVATFAQQASTLPVVYPLMHLTAEQKQQFRIAHIQRHALSVEGSFEHNFANSLSLLSRLPYTPAERNQGGCGDCWQWAGTGVMEIAHDVMNGVHDRLSVQFLNSCNSGINCCQGGWLDNLTAFYSAVGFAVPWANNNALFSSGNGSCGNSPCGNIATTPDYPITSISTVTITTHGVGQAQAIANIKSVLNQNRAIWFGFFMPTQLDWNQFFSFWNSQSESAVWDGFVGGQIPDTGDAGHAVLCVGYNDDDPANRYWIMVNSWGTTQARPNDIFLVSMDLDYDCADSTGWSSLWWETLDIKFAPSGLPAPVLNPEPPVTPGTSNTLDWTPVMSQIGVTAVGGSQSATQSAIVASVVSSQTNTVSLQSALSLPVGATNSGQPAPNTPMATISRAPECSPSEAILPFDQPASFLGLTMPEHGEFAVTPQWGVRTSRDNSVAKRSPRARWARDQPGRLFLPAYPRPSPGGRASHCNIDDTDRAFVPDPPHSNRRADPDTRLVCFG